MTEIQDSSGRRIWIVLSSVTGLGSPVKGHLGWVCTSAGTFELTKKEFERVAGLMGINYAV